MPRGCDYSVTVTVDARTFIAEFNSESEIIRIKERKLYAPGEPWERVYDASYWHPVHGWGNSENTMPKRIAAAARAKQLAEHRAADATP